MSFPMEITMFKSQSSHKKCGFKWIAIMRNKNKRNGNILEN